MIVFQCLKCGEQLEAPPSMAGQAVTCPECGNVSHVPARGPAGYGAGGGGNGPGPQARCQRVVYILLGIFLGTLGIHNFVAGYTGRAVAQLLITLLIGWLILPLIAVWIWVIVEIVVTTHDADGVRMG
jgi:TM2 domain-containing membrane protein YozV